MKIKPQNKHTLSLKEGFRLGIFTDVLGGCLQGCLFLAALPRVLGSPSVAAPLAAFPALPGSGGQLTTQPLVQHISEHFIYILYFFFLPIFLPRLSHGVCPARSCPGMLAVACFLLPLSINHRRADAALWDWLSPGFAGCVWPQSPLVLPPLHPQASAPHFLTPLQACRCLILHHFLSCPSLAISGLFFGMGAAMCSRTLAPGLGRKGAWGVDFTSKSYFYLELGKLCKPGSKKDLSCCPHSLLQDVVSSPCLFYGGVNHGSPLGYSPAFPPSFSPRGTFCGGTVLPSSSLPVTKNLGRRRCLGPVPSSNCP